MNAVEPDTGCEAMNQLGLGLTEHDAMSATHVHDRGLQSSEQSVFRRNSKVKFCLLSKGTTDRFLVLVGSCIISKSPLEYLSHPCKSS